jgi:hypothetical protein
MNPAKIKSWVGHRVREAAVHLERLQQPASDLSVVFCVDDLRNGMASDLRGYTIAEALRPLGWRSIVIPKQLELSQRQRILKHEQPQVVVLQSARHPLNRPRFYPDQFCVFDLDDADFLDPKAKPAVIECAAASQAAIAGSRYVADFLKQHCDRVEIVWTSSDPLEYAEPPAKHTPPIVCWACSNPHRYPEEGKLVQDVMTRLSSHLRCQFWLIGVRDPAMGQDFIQPIADRGIPCELIPFLPYQKLLTTLESVSIGLAPLVPEQSPFSAGKSFGKILAYLNTAVAVIASDCVDHPLFFQHGENGFLASTVAEWVESVEFLLAGPAECARIAAKAREDYIRHLSVQATAKKTDRLFRSWLKLRQTNKMPVSP